MQGRFSLIYEVQVIASEWMIEKDKVAGSLHPHFPPTTVISTSF